MEGKTKHREPGRKSKEMKENAERQEVFELAEKGKGKA